MAWNLVEPNVWKPEKVGDEIIGVLLKVEQSNNYDRKNYHLETSPTERILVFGSTVLDDRMSHVEVGTRIKIVFNGMQKNKKGQDTKIFSVYKDEPEQNNLLPKFGLPKI